MSHCLLTIPLGWCSKVVVWYVARIIEKKRVRFEERQNGIDCDGMVCLTKARVVTDMVLDPNVSEAVGHSDVMLKNVALRLARSMTLLLQRLRWGLSRSRPSVCISDCPCDASTSGWELSKIKAVSSSLY